MAYHMGPSGSVQAPRFGTTNTSHDRSGIAQATTANDEDTVHGHHNRNTSPGSSRSASVDYSRLSPGAGEANTHASESPGLPDKPRMRISKACTPCRKVKLKCNGGNPCGRCLALSLPIDECTYPPSLRGKTRRKKAEIEAERQAKQSNGSGLSKSARYSNASAGPGPSTSTHTVNHRHVNDIPRSSRGQDTTKWDDGWTMRQMKEDFAKWKHDEELVNTGPRNANLWHNPIEAIGSVPSSSRNPTQQATTSRTNNQHFISPSSLTLGLETDTIPDRYTTLPFPGDAHNPLGVLAEASASADNAGGKDVPSPSPFQPTGGPGSRPASEAGKGDDRESRGYYVPLERVLKNDAPHIMALISVHEAEQLFETYFKLLHPHLPFLDREHSTPAALAQRNNFLFNAICCVAARATNIMLWDRLKEFARFEMDRFPKDKNIDVVQGHLIYSVWNITGPMTFEQDKSWLRVGVAIRTGIDINLHRVALSKSARQGLPNWLLRMIIRTWLLTNIIDRTLSAQLGKPTTLRGEHSFQLYSELISKGEGGKTIDDVWVSSLAEWTQVLGKVHDVFGSDSSDYPAARSVCSQFPDLVHVFQKQFGQLSEQSIINAKAFDSGDVNGKGARFMLANVSLYNRYARLIVHSFGLQRASDTRKADLPSAFAETDPAQCQMSAIRLVEEFESDFEGAGFTRGCPDFIFTFLTFAAVSLLKGTQQQYAHLEPNRHSLFALARKASGILSRSAATPDHLPAIQHSFLTRLIDARSRITPDSAIPGGFTMMDFEAFGQSIDADLSKTPWPPTGPSATTQSMTRPPSPNRGFQSTSASTHFNQHPYTTTINDNNGLLQMPPPTSGGGQTSGTGQTLTGTDMNMLEPDFGWGLGVGMGMGDGNNGLNDGFGWLSGVGAAGGFGGDGDGDMVFAQDSFWRSILEGGPNGQ